MHENDARACIVDLGMQMSLAGWEDVWRMQGWGVDRFVDVGQMDTWVDMRVYDSEMQDGWADTWVEQRWRINGWI